MRRPARSTATPVGPGPLRRTSAAFVAVYVAATAAGVRLLSGAARMCAGVAFAAVVVVLAFSGVYLAVPVAVGALAWARGRRCAAPLQASPA